MEKEKLKNGVLVQFRAGRWDAKSKLNVSLLGDDIPEEIIRASQDLICDRSILKELSAIKRSAKSFIKGKSLIFPLDSVFWVPKNKVIEVNEALEDFQRQYHSTRMIVADNLKKWESDFKKQYPTFYDSNKYPTKEAVVAKFYFKWIFFDLEVPDPKRGVLSPKLYKQAQEKFKKMITEMEQMTIEYIGKKILKRIEKLNSQCQSGAGNAGTVNAINRLLTNWEELWSGHIDDKKFRMVMSRIKRQMKGTSADRIRDNEDFRNKLGTETDKIIKSLKSVPASQLRRKLDV